MPKTIAPKAAFIRPPGVLPPLPGQQSEAARWAEMSDTPLFQKAVHVALLEYQVKQASVTLQDAAVAALRLEGARGVLTVLLNLGDPTKETLPPIVRPGLEAT